MVTSITEPLFPQDLDTKPIQSPSFVLTLNNFFLCYCHYDVLSHLIGAKLWFQLWQDDEVELFLFLDQAQFPEICSVKCIYWVDHLITISNIIIAWAANPASTQSHKASVLAIARTVGHHLMDAFSWLDHPWLGRPMRHKAIFQRNVCFTPQTPPWSGLDTWECGAAGAEPDIHESLHDLAPCISQNCEILFSE